MLSAIMLVMAAAMNAQVTTSALSGKVFDTNGEAIIGATIQATHEPSGTFYGAITNVDGLFSIQGMRTGGPYKVEISYVGYDSQVITGITLALGETFELDVKMGESSEVMDEVVVTAARTKFTTLKTGASTNVSNRDILNTPSVNRSIADLAKLSPYSNGMSFAGSDGRSTNFTVDGANFNNNFGLSSSLPGGGTPISLDAIEEMQIVVAPYDVRQSNFVGGGINAVTKSGTNQFHGTAYTYQYNQDFRGNKINGEALNKGERVKESEHVYGFTVGGPIIKNKLFFFANFETTKKPGEAVQYRPDANKIKDLDRVKDKLIKDYGYDPGSYDNYPGGDKNTKILARVDWNINNQHKLAVRFNKTNNTFWYAPNGNSCDDNYRNKSYNRASEVSTAFSNNMYSQMNNVWSFSADLNSRFSEKASNQLIATYTNLNDQRGSNSDFFPQVDIMSGDYSSGNFIPYITFGYELFTYNNGVKNKTLNITDNFTYYTGAHKITAGLSYEYQTARNSYMRNATGYYRFANIDDFLNGATPLSFALTYGYDGNQNPAGIVTYNQLGAYVQDDWSINDRFKLNFGVRMDALIFDNSNLTTNNAILNYDMGGRHIDTGYYPKTRPQVSPRVGFHWDVKGDKSLIVRGGTGIFMGRLPLVFFTNMPQYSGTIQGSISKGDYSSKISDGQVVYTPKQLETLNKLVSGGKIMTDVNQMITTLGLPTKYDPSDTKNMGGNAYVSGVDRDFKMPQIWKSSVAVDYSLPVGFPLTVTGEFMFNKTIYGVMVSDWNVNTSALKNNTFAGPDNRINYAGVDYKYGKTSGYVMTNTKKGWGYNANITVKAEPVKNLNLMLSYTRTESKEISGMPGSAANSVYENLPTISGSEFTGIHRSQYVVPDKILVNVGYFLPFKAFHGNGLHLNAIYTAYSSSALSYTYSNDMNGDGLATDLMYIPKSKEDIQFKTTADADAFWAFLENDKYLSSHKGQYAEAYMTRAPWVHRLDLRIAEDFTFKIGKTQHTFELSASIENALNMFNSALGVQKWTCWGSNEVISPLKYEGVQNGKPVYSMNQVDKAYPTETFTKYNTNTSQCWKMLFGLKYRF